MFIVRLNSRVMSDVSRRASLRPLIRHSFAKFNEICPGNSLFEPYKNLFK